MLAKSGFAVGSIERRSSPNLPAGMVIEQSPAAGTAAERGARVNLVITVKTSVAQPTGNFQPRDVPDVIHRPLKQAMQAIHDSGFAVGKIEKRFWPNAPEDTVLEQHPAAGTRQLSGLKVDLVVSTGKKP